MLTLAQISAISGVHPHTLRKWIHEGVLDAFCVGRAFQVTEDVWDRFIRENTQMLPKHYRVRVERMLRAELHEPQRSEPESPPNTPNTPQHPQHTQPKGH